MYISVKSTSTKQKYQVLKIFQNFRGRQSLLIVSSPLFLAHIVNPKEFLRLMGYTVLSRCQLSLQCDLTKLSFVVLYDCWIMLLGVLLLKCSVCIHAKGQVALWTKIFSPLCYVLLTLLWKLTSLIKTFCKKFV